MLKTGFRGSLTSGKRLEDWDKFKAFNELIDELIRIGQVALVAPRDLWNKPLGGVDVSSKSMIDGTPLPNDQGNFIHQVYRKFKLKTQGEPLFSETKDMAVISSSVGVAAVCEAPVISITFDDSYVKEKLKGWLKLAEKKEVIEAGVNNIFSGSAKNLTYITDLTQCRLKNPQEEPFGIKMLCRRF